MLYYQMTVVMNGTIAPLLKATERYLQTDIRYLLFGGTWLGFARGIAMLFSFAAAVAFANLLPKETYGTYKYILSVAALLAIPALTGMTTAIIQSVAKGEYGSYLPGLRAKLTWGTLGSMGSIAVGAYYAFMGNWELGSAFLLAAPFIPLAEGFTLWESVLAGKKLFKDGAIYSVLVQAGTTIAIVTTLLLTKNVVAIVAVYFLSYTIFRWLVHRRMLDRFPELRTDSSSPSTLAFGKRLSAVGILSTLTGQLDSFLLWHFLGPTALATYAFALATTMPAKTFLKAVMYLAQPKFAEKDTATIKATANQKVWRSFLLFIPLTIVYIAILPFLYDVFFPQYVDSVIYAQVLGLMFLFFPTKLQSIALVTREEKRPIYVLATINPIIALVLVIIAVPLFGIWGAVSAILLEHVLSALTTFYFFRRMK